jgi:general secretion pathway protein N
VGQAPEAAPSWRLVALSPRSAVFEGPDGEQTLALRSYDGGADLRASAPPPRPAPRRGRAANPRQGAATPVPSTPLQVDAMDDGSAPAAEPEAVEDADAAATPQEQMEAIRKRIEARREQLRREAQGTQPPQQR